MKNRITVAVFSLFVFCGGFMFSCNRAQRKSGEGIQFFDGDFSGALNKAKTENKLVFFDAHTSWCGFCRKMERNTYSDQQVAKIFNERFVNLSVDMESGEGPSLARKYNVRVYPTIFILDAGGNLLASSEGYLSPGELIDFANSTP